MLKKPKKIVNARVETENYIKLKHISIDKCVSVTSIIEKLISDYIDANGSANG